MYPLENAYMSLFRMSWWVVIMCLVPVLTYAGSIYDPQAHERVQNLTSYHETMNGYQGPFFMMDSQLKQVAQKMLNKLGIANASGPATDIYENDHPHANINNDQAISTKKGASFAQIAESYGR